MVKSRPKFCKLLKSSLISSHLPQYRGLTMNNPQPSVMIDISDAIEEVVPQWVNPIASIGDLPPCNLQGSLP